jgi:hypothetical protein
MNTRLTSVGLTVRQILSVGYTEVCAEQCVVLEG